MSHVLKLEMAGRVEARVTLNLNITAFWLKLWRAGRVVIGLGLISGTIRVNVKGEFI